MTQETNKLELTKAFILSVLEYSVSKNDIPGAQICLNILKVYNTSDKKAFDYQKNAVALKDFLVYVAQQNPQFVDKVIESINCCSTLDFEASYVLIAEIYALNKKIKVFPICFEPRDFLVKKLEKLKEKYDQLEQKVLRLEELYLNLINSNDTTENNKVKKEVNSRVESCLPKSKNADINTSDKGKIKDEICKLFEDNDWDDRFTECINTTSETLLQFSLILSEELTRNISKRTAFDNACIRLRMNTPKISVSQSGYSHMPTFHAIITFAIDGISFECESEGGKKTETIELAYSELISSLNKYASNFNKGRKINK